MRLLTDLYCPQLQQSLSFVPTDSLSGFLRKETLIGTMVDLQLGFTPRQLDRLDGEYAPEWQRSIETLLLHKNIQAYHHLVWRSRLRTQVVAGSRLYRLLTRIAPSHVREQIDQRQIYKVSTADAAIQPEQFTVKHSADNWFN